MQNIKTVINTILDFFLPRSELDKRILEITPEKLLEKIARNTESLGPNTLVLFDYRDPLIRHMIWWLKYKKSQKVAHIFAQILNDYLVEELSDQDLFTAFADPLLIPIPLSKKRLRQRGFNQALRLGEALINISGGTYCTLSIHTLEKIKNTPSQTSLKDKNARRENIKGAFRVLKQEKIKGRNIILLDDVITTGSTLAEARRVLLEAGARRVLMIALAH